MRNIVKLPLVFILFFIINQDVLSKGVWGADYFPNFTLTDHNGKKVKFFDDLLKDKIVAINFIYTTCPDSCPLETAQLVKVQNIMGDRIGKDVFIYSITIDPEVDTPEKLKEYRSKFGAKWDFLTGNEQEIITIRRKLGLYIEELKEGSNNHNVSMIVGNQKTSRWMKRSPFENPYVLADQLGNWLDGWKSPQDERDYADAPKLRNISQGEQLFRTRCAICHTVTGNELPGAVGPDLLGVTRLRDKQWLFDWLKAPDQMLAKKDPIAMALYKKYNRVAMPNMRLTQNEAIDILTHIESETARLSPNSGKVFSSQHTETNEQEDIVAIMNAWVREPIVESNTHAGYFTLVNVSEKSQILESISTESYDKVEIHQMTHINGLMKMSEIDSLEIAANGKVKLAPGGKHLMLIGPKTNIKSGGSVELKLKFSGNQIQVINLPIKSK
ncbi:MAG: copper chaperone PCu(A)C [Kangiellaceae bacterium]|nr:copper chaperone PCu(A)C [Kangiellaceae bacterium]